jgi:hypothetical protein
MGQQRSRGNRLGTFRENSTSIQSPWRQTKNERLQYTKTRRTFACQARTRHSDSFKMNSIGPNPAVQGTLRDKAAPRP